MHVQNDLLGYIYSLHIHSFWNKTSILTYTYMQAELVQHCLNSPSFWTKNRWLYIYNYVILFSKRNEPFHTYTVFTDRWNIGNMYTFTYTCNIIDKNVHMNLSNRQYSLTSRWRIRNSWYTDTLTKAHRWRIPPHTTSPRDTVRAVPPPPLVRMVPGRR